MQSFGAMALDASLLLVPLVGFLPPDHPRVGGTVSAIERTLMRDGLVLRYDTGKGVDGFPPGKALFWHAVFGGSTIMFSSGGTARRASCSTPFGAAQR